ncbi:MAG TPA: hypothetical protein VHD15_08990 [Hyphomicrobiales bacterium]|nr:hypothetical protein [Hyphomicrobiales bacterium]
MNGKKAAKMNLRRDGITIWGNSRVDLHFSKIDSIEILDKPLMKTSDGISYGAMGAFLGGPIGMALGARFASMVAPVTFLLIGTDGTQLVFECDKGLFDKWHKDWKIYSLSRQSTPK